MAKFLVIVIFGVFAVAQAQRSPGRDEDGRRVTTTPVPILRQINKVNEDGSYVYGYENADGTYKIETKQTTGEVSGKYGYYDDTGVLREIEYGASRQGFRPQGTDVKRTEAAAAMAYDPFDDTGYYDAEKYEVPFRYNNAAAQQQQEAQPVRAAGRRPGARRAKARQQQQFSTQFDSFSQQAAAPQQAPVAYQQPQYQQPQYQQSAAPAPAPAHQYYQPQAPTVAPFHPSQLFNGHPATNFNYETGSYSVNYSG